jgi:hypothetical protein
VPVPLLCVCVRAWTYTNVLISRASLYMRVHFVELR